VDIGCSSCFSQGLKASVSRFAQAARKVVVAVEGGIQPGRLRKSVQDEEFGILTRSEQSSAPDRIIAKLRKIGGYENAFQVCHTFPLLVSFKLEFNCAIRSGARCLRLSYSLIDLLQLTYPQPDDMPVHVKEKTT
jgi:hypothetical protein